MENTKLKINSKDKGVYTYTAKLPEKIAAIYFKYKRNKMLCINEIIEDDAKNRVKEEALKRFNKLISFYGIISIELNGELIYFNENYQDKKSDKGSKISWRN